MTKLLFIKASPRDAASKTVAIAQSFVTRFTQTHPGTEVDTIDLWRENLPAFDGDKAAAKMAVITGQEQVGPQKTAWDEIVAIASRFTAADHYVLAVPMWNGGIPYRLKQYIDIIHQPGLTFGLTPEAGYFGLLKNKKATLVLTSGAYSPAAPSPAFGIDHHSTYLHAWLNQAGVTDIDEVRFQPTLLTADPAGDLAKAVQAAEHLAGGLRLAA